MTLNKVTVVCDQYDGAGNVLTRGVGYFGPTTVLTDATDHMLIGTGPVIPVVFHPAGPPTVQLIACDNTQVQPSGLWGWIFTPPVASGVAQQTYQIDFVNGSTQYLSALTPVSAPSALLASNAAGVSVYPSGDTSGVIDTAAITAAEALGRKIWLAAGTFWTTGLTKQSGTYWEGAGIGATFLKLAAGADADVIQGQGFSSLTLTGANTWSVSGIWDFGISGMTIDGNASNQSGTSYGVRVYGAQWTFRDLAVRNCLTDGIWTEWGLLPSGAPVTSDGSESTAFNVRCFCNGRHGWSHLGPSDVRKTNVLCFENNQAAGAAGIGYWALNDQVSNVCSTASGMNGTNASGFTGTFTVQAAALGGATDLYASSGTLHVTTSSGTATMTYTGKTAATFTGCTVTSGAGTFQTGNAVTTSAAKFTVNGLQLMGCHSWSNQHTWAAVLDGQVSDVDCHWEGARYGQMLVRNSTNKAGGFVYDFSGTAAGMGIQLGDNGSTPGVPLSAALKANSCDLRTRVSAFLNDTAARSSLNWVSASQSSADLLSVTKTTGTYATTVASGSNGVDVSGFTGGSPGVINVASTQNIPAGPGTLTVATANGTVTCTYTGTNGSDAFPRTAGNQFAGVVATGSPAGGSTMSTGGAVALANIGSLAIGGTLDAGSRVKVQAQSSTTALSTGASAVQEFGPRVFDVGTAANAWELKVNGTPYANFNGSSKQFQYPNGADLRGYSDNFTTKTWEIPGSTGIASLAGLALTGAAGSSSSALSALGAAGLQAASVSYKPSNPTATASATVVCMGIGSACVFTPAGTGKVLVTVSGGWTTATASANGLLSARYGTSTAPVNGASDTGTRWGTGNADMAVKAAGPSGNSPFSFAERLSLTPSTAYWFDLVTSTSNASDSATITNVVMTIQELPS